MDAAQNLPDFARRARQGADASAGDLTGNDPLPRNPYVGPTAFTANDHLYGRDRELNQLANLLVAERIVVMHSPSGAGKTSLIQAALIPRLTSMRFHVLPIARVNIDLPGDHRADGAANRYALSTLLSLDQELSEDERTPIEQLAQMRLIDYLDARAKPEKGPGVEVLIFDQFEEILTLDPTDADAKHEFFKQLGETLEETHRWVLFALRDDYIGALLPYEMWIPSQLHNRYRLDLLGHEAARQAIQRPAQEVGVIFEDEAANKLVDDLRRMRVQRTDGTLETQLGPHVEPVQLQVVCHRLWDSPRPNPRRITAQDLAAFGEVDESLVDNSLVAYYAERVKSAAENTGVSERSIREWFDHHLITEKGVRSSVLLEEKASGGLDNRAIRMLQNSYLVRAEKRSGITWFELAHDRLILPIRKDNSDWFHDHLSPFQKQADLWDQQGRPENLLMTGTQLHEAKAWMKHNGTDILPYELDFLAACENQEASERLLRQRNRAILILAFVAVVLAVLAWLTDRQANYQRGITEVQAAMAISNQFAAQSQTELREHPLRSILLAVEAINTTAKRGMPQQAAAEEALRAALAEPHGKVLPGPTGAVRQAAFSPDGRWLALGSDDGIVQLWPARNFQAAEPVPLSGHKGAITGLVFLPDGQRMATSSEDQTVRLWTLNAGNLFEPPVVLRGPGAEVTALAVSPDGRWLAASSLDQNIWLWRLDAPDAVPSALPVDGLSQALAFSPDGRRLASGDGQTVRIWELESSSPAAQPVTLAGHAGLVTSLAFSPNGSQLASGSRDNTARIWNLASSDPTNSAVVLAGHLDWVNALAFSPDGSHLATASGDKTVRVWDLGAEDPNLNPLVLRGHSEWINAVNYSPDGRWLASASGDNTARLWDLQSADPSAEPRVLQGHDDQVLTLAFSPDGHRLVTGSLDHSARLWTVEGQDISRNPVVLDHFGEQVNVLAYSPDGQWLAAGSGDPAQGSLENSIKLWRIGTNPEAPPIVLGGYRGWINALQFSPDGRWLAAGGADNAVRLWNLLSADPSAQPLLLPGHSGWVWSLAFSRDGRWLASGSEDSTVLVWDLQSPDPEAQPLVLSYDERVSALAFSPDGHWLAAGGGFEARLWNMQAEDPAAQPVILSGHSNIIPALAFDPQGRWLATGSRDSSVRLWDLRASDPGARPIVLSDPFDAVNTLAFSPDGRWLASGSADTTSLLWDMREIGPFIKPAVLTGHDGAVVSLAFSPDGKQLATGGEDGVIRLRKLDGSTALENAVALRGHARTVTTLAFSPDGSWLASGSEDQSVRLWLTHIDALVESACDIAGRNFTQAEQRQFISSLDYTATCPQWPVNP